MESQSKGQHGQGSSGAHSASATEPSLAEQARALLQRGGASSLATMSRKHAGFPFASVMPYALDEQGRPVFLISSMAMHTQNLNEDPRATLLVIQGTGAGEVLGSSRVSVIGEVTKVDDAELDAVRELYLQRNASARDWVDYDDFSFYRMNVVDIYFVGGFGVMGWIRPEEYASARPDALADREGP